MNIFSKITTAEEWLNRHALECIEKKYADINELKCLMIHFAREHIEEALKEASEKANLHEDYYNEENFSINELKELANEGYPRKDSFGDIYAVDIVSIDKNSILNAYSLENIK